MQKTHILMLLASVTLGFSTAQAKNHSKADEVSLEEQPFQMADYDQFRRMGDEKQKAYLQEVRNMLGEIQVEGVQISFFENLNVNMTAKWTAFLSLINDSANADTGYCADYTFSLAANGKDICVSKGSLGIQCQPSMTKAYIANCQTKVSQDVPSYKAPAAKQSQQYIAQSDKANDATAEAKAAADSPAPGAPTSAGKNPAVANPTGGGAPTPAASPTAPAAATPAKKFRCIYAGFTIYGADCKPQDSYVDPKTKTTYTCSSSSNTRMTPAPVTPAKPDPKLTVLCNPVFFGTVAKGVGSNGTLQVPQQPICVAKGANATSDCLKQANKNKDASLKSAVQFAKDDKAKYQELTDTVTKLCSPKSAFSNLADMPVVKNPKDLEATCVKYRERMFDYASAYGSATSSGVRAGPSASVPGAQ